MKLSHVPTAPNTYINIYLLGVTYMYIYTYPLSSLLLLYMHVNIPISIHYCTHL